MIVGFYYVLFIIILIRSPSCLIYEISRTVLLIYISFITHRKVTTTGFVISEPFTSWQRYLERDEAFEVKFRIHFKGLTVLKLIYLSWVLHIQFIPLFKDFDIVGVKFTSVVYLDLGMSQGTFVTDILFGMVILLTFTEFLELGFIGLTFPID